MDGKLLLQPGRKVSFTVMGLPKGKARPRARVIHPKGRKPTAQIYTPKSTTGYEAEVKRAVLRAMKHEPFDGPVRVTIRICFPMAKSWTKSKVRDVRRGLIAHTQKPDVDNVIKAVLDGMVITDIAPDKTKTHRGVMIDDTQIVKLVVEKDWSDTGRVTVLVTELVVPEKLPVEESPVATPLPKPCRGKKGLVKQGGSAVDESTVKSGCDEAKVILAAEDPQPRQTDPEPEIEPVLARAQCGFDGLAKDCPNHTIPGAPWCAACVAPGLRGKIKLKETT